MTDSGPRRPLAHIFCAFMCETLNVFSSDFNLTMKFSKWATSCIRAMPDPPITSFWACTRISSWCLSLHMCGPPSQPHARTSRLTKPRQLARPLKAGFVAHPSASAPWVWGVTHRGLRSLVLDQHSSVYTLPLMNTVWSCSSKTEISRSFWVNERKQCAAGELQSLYGGFWWCSACLFVHDQVAGLSFFFPDAPHPRLQTTWSSLAGSPSYAPVLLFLSCFNSIQSHSSNQSWIALACTRTDVETLCTFVDIWRENTCTFTRIHASSG